MYIQYNHEYIPEVFQSLSISKQEPVKSPVLTKHDDLNVGFFFHPAKVMKAMNLKQFLTSYI